MIFRTATVIIDGEEFCIRELSGLAVETAQKEATDVRQGYAILALSLADVQGNPIYKVEELDIALGRIVAMPARVLTQLTDAVQALNQADDAAKN